MGSTRQKTNDGGKRIVRLFLLLSLLPAERSSRRRAQAGSALRPRRSGVAFVCVLEGEAKDKMAVDK
jgi:hypothetical protein